MDPNNQSSPNNPTNPNPLSPPDATKPNPSVSPDATPPITSPLPVLPVDAVENKPVVGVFGDMSGATSNTVMPASNGTPSPNSAASVAGGVTPLAPKRSKKGLILLGSVVLLAGIATAGYYFGYYTNSKMAYSQALDNSGEALAEITKELTAQSTIAAKGYVGSGDYKIESEGFSTDGKFALKSDAKNSEFTMDIGVGVSRLDVTARTIASASTNPDIYFKIAGLSGLGDLVGPEYGAITSKYNDKWVVIDHTLLDNVQKQAIDSEALEQPTAEQLYSALNGFSTVNQDYLFSTEADKAVTVIKQDFGLKTVDDRKVFHYEVGFNKANLKKYIAAQETALKASKLNDWITANKYETEVAEVFDGMTKSVDDIKDTDTFDMYVDASKRVIYKFRFDAAKNPATNFVDVGLNYQSGDELPFFVRGESNEDGAKAKFDMKLTANAKTKAIDFKLLVEDTGNSKFKATSNFTFKPSATAVSIEKPAGALQIADVMKDLGFGDPFTAANEVGQTLGASTSIFQRQ